jgi:hypothetical protein
MSKDQLPSLPPTPSKIIEGPYDLLNIRDSEDPNSLTNLLPSWLSQAINAILEETLTMDYESLRKTARPSATESKLRYSFWNEYKRVIYDERKPKMSVNNIIGGICSLEQFRKTASSTYKLAYILQPPPSIDLAFDELIHTGLEEMLKIIKTDMVDEDGKFDTKLAALKAKIVSDVITRRTEKTVNFNINSKSQSLHHQVNTNNNPSLNPPSEASQVIDILPNLPASHQLTAREIEAAIEAEAMNAIEDSHDKQV